MCRRAVRGSREERSFERGFASEIHGVAGCEERDQRVQGETGVRWPEGVVESTFERDRKSVV